MEHSGFLSGATRSEPFYQPLLQSRRGQREARFSDKARDGHTTMAALRTVIVSDRVWKSKQGLNVWPTTHVNIKPMLCVNRYTKATPLPPCIDKVQVNE